MAKNYLGILLMAGATVLLAGCPQGNSEYNEGKKAEAVQDYDTALIHYDRALKADPNDSEYKLKAMRLRFESGQAHVEQGQKQRDRGDLQMALAEFQKAAMIDPASAIAQQETRATLDAIAAKNAAARPPAAAAVSEGEPALMAGPPELKPVSTAPVNLTMTNDAKMVYDTIGKLAGITVIFDPDFTSRRISATLTNVTLEQALDIVSLEAKAFWKPVTGDVIFVAPDQAQKRRDYEEEIVRTIYLKNNLLPQDMTEIINGLRQLLDLRRVTQSNAQNAIIIRDTPDKVMLAEKIIDDLDKPKAEVVVQFTVLQARRDRLRDLGINPGTSASISFAPPTTTSSSSSSSSTPTTAGLPLNQLQHLSGADYSVNLPGATATALLTDSETKIIDDPEIRMVDGQDAKLRIGDRIPIATGSFQAGVGVGATGAAGSIVNPLVNTQFQYQDVGVILDVTPRIVQGARGENEVALKLSITVSSVTGSQNIGGITQPVISQRIVENDVRLQDGEVNILGGLIEHTTTKSVSGWPGLADVPFLKYFFSQTNVENEDQEVLIVVTPHIVRTPEITAENLRSLASGTDTNPGIHLESEVNSPPVPLANSPVPTAAAAPAPVVPQGQSAQLRFDPATVSVKVGETTTVGLVVENAQDLYSVPMLLQFDPKVISVDDVRQGGFLSGGTQPIAIVQRVDKERGQAIVSATRMPNTPGVSGTGTLFGIVVHGVAAGNTTLSILQVNARDSQQRPLAFVTSEATIHIQ